MVILALSGVSGIHPRKLGSLPIHKAPPHYCQKAIHRSVEYELLCLLRLHWENSKLLTHSYAKALKQRKNKKFCIKLESRSSVVSQSLMVVCFRVVEVFKPRFSKMKGMLFLLIVITISVHLLVIWTSSLQTCSKQKTLKNCLKLCAARHTLNESGLSWYNHLSLCLMVKGGTLK